MIIRPDGIGDFVLWLYVSAAVRRLYSSCEYQIVLLANSAWSTWASQMNYWDEVWSLNRQEFLKNTAYRWSMWRRIRSQCFDIVIYPVYSREMLFGDSFVFFSGAKEKIGFETKNDYRHPASRFVSDQWYTKLIPLPDNLWEGRKNWEFVKGLGVNDFNQQPLLLDSLVDCSLCPEREYCVIFPVLGSAGRWSLYNFVELINLLKGRTSLQCIICGGASEMTAGAFIRNHCKDVINLTGKTTLNQLSGLIKRSKFVLGHETGAIHIAAALGVPSICITGGGHFRRFVPYPEDHVSLNPPIVVNYEMPCYGCGWKCIYPASQDRVFRCMGHISVEHVLEKIQTFLR